MIEIERQKHQYKRTKASILTFALSATFAFCVGAVALSHIATSIAAGLLVIAIGIPIIAGIGLALYRQWFNW